MKPVANGDFYIYLLFEDDFLFVWHPSRVAVLLAAADYSPQALVGCAAET